MLTFEERVRYVNKVNGKRLLVGKGPILMIDFPEKKEESRIVQMGFNYETETDSSGIQTLVINIDEFANNITLINGIKEVELNIARFIDENNKAGIHRLGLCIRDTGEELEEVHGINHILKCESVRKFISVIRVEIPKNRIAEMAHLFELTGSDYKTSVLDISNLYTGQCRDMSSMFAFARFKTIHGIEDMNVSQVEGMDYMFAGCNGINSLDLSRWEVKNVKGMSAIFDRCRLIKLDLRGWDIGRVLKNDASIMRNRYFGKMAPVITYENKNDLRRYVQGLEWYGPDEIIYRLKKTFYMV